MVDVNNKTTAKNICASYRVMRLHVICVNKYVWIECSLVSQTLFLDA